CSTFARPSSSTSMLPSRGRPSAESSSAWNTGSPSKRGMQHQTTAPPWSTSALIVQLPISARSSDAGLPVLCRTRSGAWIALRWFSRDLNARGALVTNALSDSISGAISESRLQRLQTLFDRAVQDERLYAIGLCSLDGTLLRRTASFPQNLSCREAQTAAMQP